MTTINTIAGHAGRIAGTTIRVVRQINEQIDWREVFTIVVLGLVTVALLTYEAGRQFGLLVHRLNNALTREWVAACGVLERPATETAPAPVHDPAPAAAPQPVVATVRESLPTGIDLARHLVAAGHSQRQSAKRARISRTSLQRALMAA